MQIAIEATTFSLALARRRYVERLMTFALGANSNHIDTVEVWLSEFRVAGEDYRKRCLVRVRLTGNTLVISECTDADLRMAIHRAANLAGRKVSHSIVRRVRAGGPPRLGRALPSAVGNPTGYAGGKDAA